VEGNRKMEVKNWMYGKGINFNLYLKTQVLFTYVKISLKMIKLFFDDDSYKSGCRRDTIHGIYLKH
jgi:hypothetical protein